MRSNTSQHRRWAGLAGMALVALSAVVSVGAVVGTAAAGVGYQRSTIVEVGVIASMPASATPGASFRASTDESIPASLRAVESTTAPVPSAEGTKTAAPETVHEPRIAPTESPHTNEVTQGPELAPTPPAEAAATPDAELPEPGTSTL
ncbi:hypothetical protein JCM9534A_46590 [Catenuloplanes indicus JCM 9534]|uniref:Uncharacterized protein n=1 Tax=Catenuloplanes indicus TaxID=137267 RepID=A0AAE3W1U4_9ACTN|nr:hypothetical protein [Catenuloplanes indicus]